VALRRIPPGARNRLGVGDRSQILRLDGAHEPEEYQIVSGRAGSGGFSAGPAAFLPRNIVRVILVDL